MNGRMARWVGGLLAAAVLGVGSPALAQYGFFVPDPGAPAALSVTTSTSRVLLAGTSATTVLSNTGSVAARCRFGDVSVTAAATDSVIAAGMSRAYGTSGTYLACITASGSTSIVAETGSGTAAFGGGSSSSSVTATTAANANAADQTSSEGASDPFSMDLSRYLRVTSRNIRANGSTVASYSSLMGVSDGTNQQQVLAPFALGNGVNGNNMVAVAGWVWNGTTWDKMLGDATNGLKIQSSIFGTAAGLCAGYASSCSMDERLAAIEKALEDVTTVLPFNISQIAGITPLMGNGVTGTGSLRVTIASDNTPFGVKPTASTTGGATPYHLITAASTNSTLVSTGAHTLYSLSVTGLNTTAGWLRVYDTAAAPTCSSATGASHSYLVLGSATVQGGMNVPIPSQGEAYANGFSFCFTGGSADTDNTSGPSGVAINATYK